MHAEERGRWSPIHDLMVNYVGIRQQSAKAFFND
jgi:hypothetical protein